MELRQVAKTLQRWWWLILAGTLAAAAISYLATKATPNTYLSRVTLLVGQPFKSANVTGEEIGTAQTLAEVYAGYALRDPVLVGTLQALKLDWDVESLRGRVSTRVPPNSSLIEISVVDTDPQRAQVFADTIARQVLSNSPGASNQDEANVFTRAQMVDLQKKILVAQDEVKLLDDAVSLATSAREIAERRSRIEAKDTQITSWQATYSQLQRNLLEGSPNVITVIEQAALPTTPIGPRMTQNVAVATLVGLIVALLVAFGLELIDDTIKSTEDASRTTALSVLGSVAWIRGADYPSKLVAARTDSNRAAEAFRVLRTNLQFSAMGKPFHTLMVTSTRPKEGKSVTSSNLSMVIAQSGRRTVLVDCDMRRPTQHTIFELGGERGFTNLFLDESVRIEDVASKVSQNLWVIPSGAIPHNPAELLDSMRMNQLIELLKSQFDLVVFDVPPVLSVADATILAAKVDAVLMVVDSGFTRRVQAKRAKDALSAVGARILGVVVNRVSESSEEDYYYDYSSRRNGETGKRRRRKGLLEFFQPQRRSVGPTPRPVKLVKPAANGTASVVNGNGHSAGERAKVEKAK